MLDDHFLDVVRQLGNVNLGALKLYADRALRQIHFQLSALGSPMSRLVSVCIRGVLKFIAVALLDSWLLALMTNLGRVEVSRLCLKCHEQFSFEPLPLL